MTMDEDGLIASVLSVHRERGWRLDFPPATEAKIATAERALGFPLPPLLCRL
jgi:hypothetical protein